MKRWIHVQSDTNVNYDSVLSEYSDYLDAISDVISRVAAKYDSDMSYNYRSFRKYKKEHIAESITKYNIIYVSRYDIHVTKALGLDAVDPEEYGLPEYYLNGDVEVPGPLGIYYNGKDIELSLKYFDADLKRLETAVSDYFEALKISVKTGSYTNTIYMLHEDSYPEREEERNQEKTAQKKRSSTRWSSIVNKLIRESEEGIDPLYEQTEAGSFITEICTEVEDKLGMWLEPSVQGGSGGIWIHDSDTDEIIAEGIDYQTYNETVLDRAINSKNKTEFARTYKGYLEDLMS